MKSISVRDIGAALMNMPKIAAGKNSVSGDFQKIWSNQMNKGTRDSQSTAEKQNADVGQSTEAVKKTESSTEENSAQECGQVQQQQQSASDIREEKQVQDVDQETTDEMSPGELEKVMELLGSAAIGLMQQTADVFGITMEELQAVMNELNMEPADLLDASMLGNLILQLDRAEDISALVTDESLYGRYRALMEQLQGVLQEKAEETDMDPEALAGLAKAVQSAKTVDEAEDQNADKTGMDISEAASDGAENTLLQRWQEARNASDQSGGQAGEGERKSESKDGKGEYTNLLIQNVRNEQFQPGAVQTDTMVQNSPWTEQTRDIMDQIMDYMKLQLEPDSTGLEMQLHPASLGTLQVQIASKGGIVTANFIAQNEAVKAALESQMIQLKESFEEQGVKVEAIEVTVQTHEFERNLEQGRGRNQQEPERKSRVRRINLGDPNSMEIMDEEDALTVEMMAADGSTVNYTA